MSFYDEIANDLWEVPTDENGEPLEGYDYIERGDDEDEDDEDEDTPNGDMKEGSEGTAGERH